MQRVWRPKLETDWTPRDTASSVSGSKFVVIVADVSDPMTPSHSRFSCLLFAYCVMMCEVIKHRA